MMADMNGASWPAEPGTYALLIDVADLLELTVGRLGRVRLIPGHYIYVGSAHGPGGLRSRITRHMRRDRRRHWHIDYLTEAASVSYVYFEAGMKRLECPWSQALLNVSGAMAPILGFGSSDCRQGCLAHLIRLPDGFQIDRFEEILRND
jgi:Uri superfamily endonuclease